MAVRVAVDADEPVRTAVRAAALVSTPTVNAPTTSAVAVIVAVVLRLAETLACAVVATVMAAVVV